MPKISVIIPVYNVEKYLRECLDSVVKQTLDDIEIICINDGSTDNSLNILKEYASNDARFVIIDKENTGQGDSRNIGMDRATGEYIAFLDSDDWLDLDTFRYIYDVFERVNAEVIHFNYTKFNEYSNKYVPQNFSHNIWNEYKIDLDKIHFYNISLLKNDCFTMLDLISGTRIYSAEFLRKFNLKFAPTKNAEDHLFVNSVLLNANNIYYIDKNFYFYRIRIGSTVRSKTDDNFCIFRSINIFRNYLIKHNFYSLYEEEFEKYKIQVFSWCYCQIPDNKLKKYLNLVKLNLDKKSYKLFLKKIGPNSNFLQKIFSVKNEYSNTNKYKIIEMLFFFHFRIKCKIKYV